MAKKLQKKSMALKNPWHFSILRCCWPVFAEFRYVEYTKHGSVGYRAAGHFRGPPLGWVPISMGKSEHPTDELGVPPWLRNPPDFFIWKPRLIFVRHDLLFTRVSWYHGWFMMLPYSMKPSFMEWWNYIIPRNVHSFDPAEWAHDETIIKWLITNRLAVMMSSGGQWETFQWEFHHEVQGLDHQKPSHQYGDMIVFSCWGVVDFTTLHYYWGYTIHDHNNNHHHHHHHNIYIYNNNSNNNNSNNNTNNINNNNIK